MTTNEKQRRYYRVSEYNTDCGVSLELETFYVVKETPCGVWVRSQYSPSWLDFAELKKHKELRWIKNNSNKKYCYPTIEGAILSFRFRKERQFQIITSQLNRVSQILQALNQWKDVSSPDEFPVNL